MLLILFINYNKFQNTIDEWHWIFMIGAGAYILPALIYWVIGSGKIQKWNELEDKSAKEEMVNTKL